jgi:hypothetical protein
MSDIRAMARRARTLVVQLLLVFALLEIGLRGIERTHAGIAPLLYNPYVLGRYEEIGSLPELLATTSAGFTPHAKRGDFMLNSKSFRTREYAEAKAPDTTRIVLIGDSFTAGSGNVPYADHWGVRLEARLRERLASDRIEVIKLGIGGVGPRFELRLWEIEGSRLSADWVVLGFCIGNDFTDEQIARQTPGERVVARSYVLRLLRNLARLRGAADPREILLTGAGGHATADPDFAYDPDTPSFTEAAFADLVASRMAITLHSRRDWFDQLFEDLKPVLSLFDASVRESGAQPLFLLIPEEYQLDPGLVRAAAAHVGRRPEDYDVDRPQRELRAWFERNAMTYLDLTSAFRDAARSTVLYKRRDTHWNIEGNELASEELSRFLAGRMEAGRDARRSTAR